MPNCAIVDPLEDRDAVGTTGGANRLMFDQTEQIVVSAATLILAGASLSRGIFAVRLGSLVAGLLLLAVALVAGAQVAAFTSAVLVAVNMLRLLEFWRLQTAVRATRADSIDPREFEEHFRRERHQQDDMLFLKGNPGNYAYYVSSGEVSIPEVSATVSAGEFFGEFALFTDGGLRTASAVCRTEVILYRIDAEMLATTFRRRPEFAFSLVRQIVQRMTRNNDRLTAENAKLRIDRQIFGPDVL